MVQTTTRPSTPLAGFQPTISRQKSSEVGWGVELTAKFANSLAVFFVDPHCADSILVNRFELRVNLGLSLEIHLTEHVQGRLFPDTTGAGSCLVFNRSNKLPSTLVATEPVRLAILRSETLAGAQMVSETGWEDLT